MKETRRPKKASGQNTVTFNISNSKIDQLNNTGQNVKRLEKD